MIRVILHGACGHMGHVLQDLIAQEPQMEVVAGIDPHNDGAASFPVFAAAKDCDVEADAIIDFATAAAVDDLLDFAVGKRIPLVLCTTGLSEMQIAAVMTASEQIPVLRSANMSLGINTLMSLLAKAAPIFAEAGFDIEIVEKHHNRKLDAPSGTAISLADSINTACQDAYHYVYDRSGRREKRDPKEIGISAVRGGSIVGEHEVIFAGTDEVVTFTHTAYSRAIFAKGAIAAAKYLNGKEPGLYNMGDVVG